MKIISISAFFASPFLIAWLNSFYEHYPILTSIAIVLTTILTSIGAYNVFKFFKKLVNKDA